MDTLTWHRHAWLNRLQTLLLISALLGISALAGFLLLGEGGIWLAFGAGSLALLVEPAASAQLTLRLYRARAIQPQEAPELWRLLRALAARASLRVAPTPHYVPSPIVNAFAVGSRERSAVVVTDGLLRRLSQRELAGVLAHEVAHIAHGDLRVMSLADYVSRLTSLFALTGQALLILGLPLLLLGMVTLNIWGLLLLVASPHLALLAQLRLSRVRELDADLQAVALTGDPEGLASALLKIERASRSWRGLLLPGWGNPEPSWLRTHPATEERIRRLIRVPPQHPSPPQGAASLLPVISAHRVRSAPRWYPGGYWW